MRGARNVSRGQYIKSIAAEIDYENVKTRREARGGARTTFMNAYNETKNIEEAKKALEAGGFNLDIFDDEILNSWIEEEKGDER